VLSMLWIVGPVYTEFLEHLSERQIPFGLFVTKPPKHASGAKKVVIMDLLNPKAIRQVLQEQELAVSSVVALYEQYVMPEAVIAQYYGLSGMPLTAAKACTNKLLMRQRFMDFDPAITPAFAEAGHLEEALAFAETHGYPVVMKPSNLMKSLLVTTSHSAAELARNFQQTMQNLAAISAKFHAATAPLIIEECMIGTMHTVAAFVDQAGQPHLVPHIADCQTAQDIGKGDNYLFSRTLPSALDNSQQTAILEVADKAIRSLGMRSSAAHVEIMLTADGPKIIEVAARLGGYRPRMYRLACGIDMYGALLSCVQGTNPDISGRQQAYAAALEIFPDKEGTCVALNNPGLLALPSVRYYHTYAKPGKKVGPARLGYKAGVVIVLSNVSRGQLAADCTAIKDGLLVTVG
jgi:biotin carboxylase